MILRNLNCAINHVRHRDLECVLNHVLHGIQNRDLNLVAYRTNPVIDFNPLDKYP